MPQSDLGREIAQLGAALPSYSDDDLARLDAGALIDLLITDEDRVPRNVIDAAARLGDAMVAALRDRLAGPWDDAGALGPWWLRLHAVMILGLIAQENAGLLLIEFMRRMDVAEDINLQDWLASEWPALFANKPASVLPRLRDLCADRDLDWYIRACALDAVLAMAERDGPSEFDASLAWVARMAADEQEDWDTRLSCGSALLDFPREVHRSLVDDLAARQTGPTAHFDANDITRAYAVGDDPPWRRHGDPWNFYTPESIGKRLERWATEDAEDDGDEDAITPDDDTDVVLPYVRDTPKVGRNDPCPCGSGRKYKKCCLPKLES